MTLNEFYDAVGSDYSEVLNRLNKEERIVKYLLKFASENTLEDFEKSYETGNFEEAFRVVHSMKGMCLNLGLSKLCDISSDVCVDLRNGPPKEDISEKIDILRKEYNIAMDNIKLISKTV